MSDSGNLAMLIARGQAQYGEQFDASSLEPRFAPYLRTNTRIKVRRVYDNGEIEERTGRVGVTTGWRPAFLLMHRSSDTGSSDVLGSSDEIVAVKVGRYYIPVSNLRYVL